MTIIFGGAYQVMEVYAREAYGARRFCMLDEQSREIDFTADAVMGLEKYVLGCVRRGEDPRAAFEGGKYEKCLLIGMDFSCGVVPMDAETRRWRDENGRLNNYLSARAERVVRMFCGLPQVLK